MTVGGWTAAIAAAADALTATAGRDAWQRAELQRLLDDVEREAAVAGAEATTLALAEVRALLAARLEGRPTRTNFRTGHLTICTLVPMRSVPHRVVCLLGLDDGEFPRKSVRDGDDLVLRDPHVGDRDSRTEDRQMLLDALMAATDRLIVTYTGKDERTNTPRPPAVPVGELLDVVDAHRARRTRRAGRARDRVLVQHPLQPFDPRNFTRGELVPERPWGFDRVTLQGARALGAPRTAAAAVPRRPAARGQHAAGRARRPRPIRRTPCSGIPAPAARDHARRLHRGGRRRADGRARPPRAVGRRHAAAGGPARRRGDGRVRGGRGRARAAPAGPARRAGDRAAAPDRRGARRATRCGSARARRARPTCKVALGDGRILSGTVPGIHGDLLRVVQYSRVAPKHRIALWVRWLALTAAYPDRPIQAVLMGRASPARRGR